MKFTPGPWEVDTPRYEGISVIAKRDDGATLVAKISEVSAIIDTSNALDDARLIAEAPKMYEFLKLVMASLPENYVGIRAVGQCIMDELEGI